MDVTIATGTFHPEIGGPPRYLRRLAHELAATGHAVRIVTFAEFEGHDPEDPCPVVRISRRRRVAERLARMAAALVTSARRTDLLYVNDHGLAPALANLWLARPLVLKIVGDFAWEYSVRHGLTRLGIDEFQSARSHPKSRLVHALQRFYARRADRVIVPSNYLSGIVTGWGVPARRVAVIPNAAETPWADEPPPPRSRAKAELGLPFPFLVTIARLTPWKGIDHLIELVGSLDPAFRLVVAGEGPERENLESRARAGGVADRVVFLGRVPPERVGLLLAAADLFVLFTGYEGMSHVLLEALAAGAPIVASRMGGNPEVVTDGADGVLVSYPDPGELRRVIPELLGDPERRDRLSAAARERSRAFSWSRTFAATLRVFEQTIAYRGRIPPRGRPA